MKILVAMSGGVDSSVAALLLKKAGHEVSGITLKLWEENSRCCNLADIHDAAAAARKIGIPHHAYDLKKNFLNEVVDYFIDSYRAGVTPNPCVICNQRVKMGTLLALSREWGFQALATGHYAGIGEFQGFRLLRQAADQAKSQEYFLCFLKSENLSSYFFPIGELSKTEARTLAREAGLPVAEKKDSQDVCFIPKHKKLWEVFPELLPKKPGKIVTEDGKVLGTHQGYYFQTIGQRRGLNLGLGVPYYVIRIVPAENLLVAGPEERLFSTAFCVSDLNIFFPGFEKLELSVKVRFAAKPTSCLVEPQDKGYKVTLSEPARAITSGQIACFYHGKFVVAAGVITANP
ncbi:MAG: tRNA 2-thiouridine(34) synthase MnmA [Candidatus Wallbacteria bacterium]|nr:tRNA 2-thiouridine(34) synthase MnmA [Candidatus Wallbacteria bacterium]